MRRFIFGYDQQKPAACAQELLRRGIDAVVAGSFSPDAARAFDDAGIDRYLCYGAHPLNGCTPRRTAVNPSGAEKRWFSSGCPNDTAANQAEIDRILDMAETDSGLKGIFVDGARFASFASAEGEDAFFTCFCPHCMAKMRCMGMDAEGIRQAAERLQHSEAFCPEDTDLLVQWFRFREHCVAEYMESFAEAIHHRNPAWQAGAFIFAPSLAYFVGQTAAACASADILSPMLYRAYPHSDGPACLNHEWAAFRRLFQGKADHMLRLSTILQHAEVMSLPPDTLLHQGFPPQAIALETALAVQSACKGQLVAPIIQLEDELLADTEHCVMDAHADGVGFFAYGMGELPHQPSR